ncbi:MAG TPA: Tim44/TimA family putative adaptor protein [Roseiarcus sp.]|nr:Tim44/TimA family putative adaptor protein [Roseiarcus sp.]
MTIDPITIVFAVVAIFVAWRLWSVLGTRTGAERPPVLGPRGARGGGDIVDVTPNPPPPVASAERWRGVAEPGSALARGLDAVAAGDPSFDAQHFLAGARAAYEMIINAFAAGDDETLRRLLGPAPLANFSQAIEARKAAGQRMIVTLVSIDNAEIVDAGVQNGAAQIAIKFVAKLNSVTTDPAGRVVEGSATEVADHTDVWTFARPLAARDPNWLLTATEATH